MLLYCESEPGTIPARPPKGGRKIKKTPGPSLQALGTTAKTGSRSGMQYEASKDYVKDKILEA
jgi:hypothetical protein